MFKGGVFSKNGTLPTPAGHSSSHVVGEVSAPFDDDEIIVPDEQIENSVPLVGEEVEEDDVQRNDDGFEEDPYNVIPSTEMVDVPLGDPPENTALLDPDRKSVNRSV